MAEAPDRTKVTARRTEFAVPKDPLSQIADQVRLTSLFCGLLRVSPPFAVRYADGGLHVLLVTHGQMYMELEHRELVETGDVILLPRGGPYSLFYPLDAPRTHGGAFTRVDDSSKPQPDEIEIVGMVSRLDRVHRNLLTDFLPPVIHLKRGTRGLKLWLKPAMELFRTEYRASAPGRSAILSRLGEIISVQVLRIWIEQETPSGTRWLQGLKDEGIALSLQAIHAQPEHRWTVESLAASARMSRTVFATRFKALVGESPMEYVSRWRMHRAVALLEERTGNLKAVIEGSGYKSAATFRTNFKRHFGMLPRDYSKKT